MYNKNMKNIQNIVKRLKIYGRLYNSYYNI